MYYFLYVFSFISCTRIFRLRLFSFISLFSKHWQKSGHLRQKSSWWLVKKMSSCSVYCFVSVNEICSQLFGSKCFKTARSGFALLNQFMYQVKFKCVLNVLLLYYSSTTYTRFHRECKNCIIKRKLCSANDLNVGTVISIKRKKYV